jgi:hypothetical protein
MSIASCCMSSDISAFFTTALRSASLFSIKLCCFHTHFVTTLISFTIRIIFTRWYSRVFKCLLISIPTFYISIIPSTTKFCFCVCINFIWRFRSRVRFT